MSAVAREVGMANVVELHRDTVLFEAAERRLNEWGAACRRSSQATGGGGVYSLAHTAEKIREHIRKRRDIKRKTLRKLQKQWKEGDPPIDAKVVAEGIYTVELGVTAHGKQPHVLYDIRVTLSSDVLQVDEVVRGLPAWMREPIFRTYLHTPQQPFRIAARELRMDEAHYRSQWRAAVKQVAEKLAERSGRGVK